LSSLWYSIDALSVLLNPHSGANVARNWQEQTVSNSKIDGLRQLAYLSETLRHSIYEDIKISDIFGSFA